MLPPSLYILTTEAAGSTNTVFFCTTHHAVTTQKTVNLQFSEVKTSTAKVEEE